jgi:regulator of protease activity HflC (stomatin/prohibitin superfamily)
MESDISFTLFLVLFFTVLICFFIVPSMVHIVRGKTAAIVETFGKPATRALMPGLQFTWPWPIQQVVGRMNLQLQAIRADVEVKTRDNAFVKLPVTVQYCPDNEPTGVVRAYYELANPAAQISSFILNTVRQSAAAMTIAELFENRSKIEDDVNATLGTRLRSMGYEIHAVLVDQPQPSPEVQISFNRVIAAQREAEAARMEAEAARIKQVGMAQAEAESKKLQGEGIAKQRRAIAEGAKEAMDLLRDAMPDLSSRELLSFMLETNRLDTLSVVGQQGNTLIIDTAERNRPMADMAAAFATAPKVHPKN